MDFALAVEIVNGAKELTQRVRNGVLVQAVALYEISKRSTSHVLREAQVEYSDTGIDWE